MGSAQDQAVLWGAAAEGWRQNIESQHVPLWSAMFEALQPLKDKKLLDAGCGAGAACVLATRHGAKVFGLDATPEFVGMCQTLCPDGDFRVGDLEDLPYENGSFDAVFACNAVQFTYDPAKTLSEFKRVLNADGKAVVAIFTAPERNGLWKIMSSYVKLLPERPRVGSFALSAPGLLDTAIQKSGLNIANDIEVPCDFICENIDQFWKMLGSNGPTQQVIRTHGEAVVREAAGKVIEPMTNSTGQIRIENTFRLVTLEK